MGTFAHPCKVELFYVGLLKSSTRHNILAAKLELEHIFILGQVIPVKCNKLKFQSTQQSKYHEYFQGSHAGCLYNALLMYVMWTIDLG